jgi:dCTP deaminase
MGGSFTLAILTDADLEDYIKSGNLGVEPLDDMDRAIQPASLELRLGNTFRVFEHEPGESFIDTKDIKSLEGKTRLVTVPEGEAFVARPKELALGTTLESIRVPDDLVGWIEGRSSFARIGIMIHVTAGFIHPGSSGRQTLEILNVTNTPVRLYPGAYICQIVFETTKSKSRMPYSKRHGSKYVNMKEPESYKPD